MFSIANRLATRIAARAILTAAVYFFAFGTPSRAQEPASPPPAPSFCNVASPATAHIPPPHLQSYKTKNLVTTPPPGQAIVFFIQDDHFYYANHRPVVQWFLDGAPVGVTASRSFFYVTIAPGEHSICSRWQSPPVVLPARLVVPVRFTAKPDRISYFRVRNLYFENGGMTDSVIERIDPIDAITLIRHYHIAGPPPQAAP